MKNKKTKKSLKDLFAFGGTAMNVDSPSQDLGQFKRITEEAMIGSQYDPTVMGLQGLGSFLTGTGMSMATQGLGNANVTNNKIGGFLKNNMSTISSLLGGVQGAGMMATGGVAHSNIEAEGQEVIETPDGMSMELKGPSHAQGGIDMTVPHGTEIYSKRLKGDDGKTFADRKKSREKEIMRLEKLIEKNPTDATLKKTLSKIKTNTEQLDQKDLSQMEFVKNLVQSKTGQQEQFAGGGYVDGFPIKPDFLQIPEWYLDPSMTGFNSKGVFNPNVFAGVKPMSGSIEAPNAITNSQAPVGTPMTNNTSDAVNPVEQAQAKSTIGGTLKGMLGSTTPGDVLGMAGNLFGAVGGLKNTLNQRGSDVPEVNQFQNFGKDALASIQGQFGFIDDVRDNQLQDLELARRGTISRNNASARSINTQRALNLATDSQMNDSRSNVQNQYAQQMMSVLGQQAGQQNMMDEASMRGEQQRAENEVRNKDNFYSNLAKNISSMGTATALTGKSLNDAKERDTTLQILKDIYPNFYVDENGITRSKITGKIVELPKPIAQKLKK